MKRLLVVLAGLIGLIGALAVTGPVHAYPPTDPEPVAQVNRGTVPPGGSVVFSGRAAPFEVLTITVTYRSGGSTNALTLPRRVPRAVVGTVTADAQGDWSITLTLDRAGVAVLKATGPISGTFTREVRVRRTSGASLAATGVADGKLPVIALSGAGAVLLGGLLVFGAVRWRRRTVRVDA